MSDPVTSQKGGEAEQSHLFPSSIHQPYNAGYEGHGPEMDRGLSTGPYLTPQAMLNPPNDYLIWAIAASVCCCWPIGIFAIWQASACRVEIARGDRPLAERRSTDACRLTAGAAIVGIVFLVGIIIYMNIA